MKFELNNYPKTLTDDDILKDISCVAQKLKVDYLSISTYKAHGTYSQTAIQGHFGTWKNALHLAGLRTERNSHELKSISDEDYFSDLNRVAKMLGLDTVPYDVYKKHGKYSGEHIFHRFGKWNTALQKAGLNSTGFSKDKITEQQCYDEIERIWTLLGRQPTTTDIVKEKISLYSIDTFKRRFGSWRKALESFVHYINSENNSSDAQIQLAQNNENLIKSTNSSTSTPIDNQENLVTITPTRHQTPRNVTARLRFMILKRDNFKCCACGASPAKDPSIELHVDHIIPWSKGGETTFENLQTLCSRCNLGKSNVL